MSANSNSSLVVLPISTSKTGRSTPITAVTPKTMRLFKTSGSVFAAGMPSKSPVYCNSLQVLHVSLSTVSRISRVAMGRDDLQSRRRASLISCQSRIHGMLPRYSMFICSKANMKHSFNRLDLPGYKTFEALNQKLTIAVEETVGFGQE
jgi:hypothetical protein